MFTKWSQDHAGDQGMEVGGRLWAEVGCGQRSQKGFPEEVSWDLKGEHNEAT